MTIAQEQLVTSWKKTFQTTKRRYISPSWLVAGTNAKRTRSWLDSLGQGLAASDHQENHPNFLFPSFLAQRLRMDHKSLHLNQHRAPFPFHPNNLMSSQLLTLQTLGRYRYCICQLINWAVAARKNYLGQQILASKIKTDKSKRKGVCFWWEQKLQPNWPHPNWDVVWGKTDFIFLHTW